MTVASLYRVRQAILLCLNMHNVSVAVKSLDSNMWFMLCRRDMAEERQQQNLTALAFSK